MGDAKCWHHAACSLLPLVLLLACTLLAILSTCASRPLPLASASGRLHVTEPRVQFMFGDLRVNTLRKQSKLNKSVFDF